MNFFFLFFLTSSIVFTVSEVYQLRIKGYVNKLLIVTVSAVPIATEPAVGQPTDDVLSINVSDAFAGSHATSSCGVYGSAAIYCSAANGLPAPNAGKQNVACLLAPVCVRACLDFCARAHSPVIRYRCFTCVL